MNRLPPPHEMDPSVPAHLAYMVAEAREALADGDQDVAEGVCEVLFTDVLTTDTLQHHADSRQTKCEMIAEAVRDWIMSTAGRDWWANRHPAPAEDLSSNGVGSGWVL